MCDQDHFENDRQEYESLGLVTRKQFGVMLGAGIAMMLPQVANAAAVTEADLGSALELIEWVTRIALPSGVLAEQVHPETGGSLSVSPLTWSHSTFVATVCSYQARLKELRGN